MRLRVQGHAVRLYKKRLVEHEVLAAFAKVEPSNNNLSGTMLLIRFSLLRVLSRVIFLPSSFFLPFFLSFD